MKIFVLHYSKLVQRKQHILEQFERHGITDYEFIEKFDKDEITDDECPEFDKEYITNKRTELSLHLKHVHVYRLMISENYENALVFEDDVILSNNFMLKLNTYMTQLPRDYDMLFIGDGCKLHIEQSSLIPNKYVYEKCLYETHWGGGGATRCTDSYVINITCAKKLCEYISNLTVKINSPVDWWLNVAARDNNLNIYWAEPTIVTQGSQNGLFFRTI